MAERKTKRSEAERKPQPTVQHESSAGNAQDLGIPENSESKNQAVNVSFKRRRHNGSDGADQERGSNH